MTETLEDKTETEAPPTAQARATRPCREDPDKNKVSTPDEDYALNGPQVEPAAAYWLVGDRLPQVVPLQDVLRKLGGQNFPFPVDTPTIQAELAELVREAGRRDDELPDNEISDFINLQDPPHGAIFNTNRSKNYIQYRVDNVNMQDQRIPSENALFKGKLVRTRGEVARMFEQETPGLVHRGALNWLLYNRPDISPIRHARIWMALDVAIYSTRSAAWFFKWAAGPGVSFRLRPYEFDRGRTFSVPYDRVVPNNGDERPPENQQGEPRGCPCPSPGTPRHPAYPSGHSTYSAAASRILQYFFADDAFAVEHLRRLANNIGEARIWGGVHWRSDHTFGQRVGNAVAECLIGQLKQDCVPELDRRTLANERCTVAMNNMPPTPAELEALERARHLPCPQPDLHDRIPTGRPNPADLGIF